MIKNTWDEILMKNISLEYEDKTDTDNYYINNIIKAVNTLDFYSMREAIKDAFDKGISIIDIVKKGILVGLEESGEMGLILAAEALEEELILNDEEEQKRLAKSQKYSGKVVIGTIKGDIHSLGKNIANIMMKSYGMDVIDLGVDVDPKQFEKFAYLPEVKVIGISFLLSSVEPRIKEVMSLLKKGELKDKIKVILGGAAVSPEIAAETNADAYALDAIQGVNIIDKWLRN
ncbi:MAG: cobalamin-dependent protein [Candidatus Lokiarchaeia archaeon]|nr:cobalamin-dependent protein [Candidatus Lokiarchaeia archaeon]